MHCSKFSHIVVDKTAPIDKNELYVVMFLLLIFVIIENILSLHPQVGNNGIIFEFEDEMLAISIDICEGLTDKSIYELGGIYFLYYVWIEGFYCSYFPCFGEEAD